MTGQKYQYNQPLLNVIAHGRDDEARLVAFFALMKADRLLFEYMYEVYSDRFQIGFYEITDKDFLDFIERKAQNSSVVAKWSVGNLASVRSKIKSALCDANLAKRNGDTLLIQCPIIDDTLRVLFDETDAVYGSKYCKESPTIDEAPLQNAILVVINSIMSDKAALTDRISSAISMELVPLPGERMSVADIDRRIAELTREFDELFSSTAGGDGFKQYSDQFKRITEDTAALKEKRKLLLEQQKSDSVATRRVQDAMAVLDCRSAELEWNENVIHQLVDTVKVLSPEKIRIYFTGGHEVETTL